MRYVPMRSPIGVLFFRLRRAKLAAPPLSSPPRSPDDFADLRRCIEGVLPTDPGVAPGAIEGVRPIEPGVRSARSDAIVASFVGGDGRVEQPQAYECAKCCCKNPEQLSLGSSASPSLEIAQ